jgi:hypothetical protein
MTISYHLLPTLLTRPTVRMGLRTSTLSRSKFGRSGQHCWDFHKGTSAPCGRGAVIVAVVVGGPGHSRAHVTRGLAQSLGLVLRRVLEKHVLAQGIASI